jgi:hypothetical protein
LSKINFFPLEPNSNASLNTSANFSAKSLKNFAASFSKSALQVAKIGVKVARLASAASL